MVLSEMVLLGVPLDYVVNVDGLNEVALGGWDARGGHHPLFPARWEMRLLVDMGRGAPSDAIFESSAEIIRNRRAAERIESHATGWLGRSQLVRAFAGALASRHHRRAEALEAGLQSELTRGADAGLMASIPDPCLGREDGCRELIADIWARSSRLMAAEASSIGAGYLHALQPSQYVSGSKRLTDEERQQAYAPGSVWMKSVQADYPLLRERATALSARGVDFLDLDVQLRRGDRLDLRRQLLPLEPDRLPHAGRADRPADRGTALSHCLRGAVPVFRIKCTEGTVGSNTATGSGEAVLMRSVIAWNRARVDRSSTGDGSGGSPASGSKPCRATKAARGPGR